MAMSIVLRLDLLGELTALSQTLIWIKGGYFEVEGEGEGKR